MGMSLGGMLGLAGVSLEELMVCLSYQLSIQLHHTEISHGVVFTPRKSAHTLNREIFSPARPVMKHLPAHPWPY